MALTQEQKELLIQAKLRYPKGTIFDSLGGNCDVEVIDTNGFKFENKDIIIDDGYSSNKPGYIYYSYTKSWAKITKSVVPEGLPVLNREVGEYEIY